MTLKQMQPSNRGSNDRRTISFLCTADDDNDALNQLSTPGTLPNGAPAIYDGLPIVDGRITPVSEVNREWFPGEPNKRLYRADAIYTLSPIAIISQKTDAAPSDMDLPTGSTPVTESDDPDKNLYSFDVTVQDNLEYVPDNQTQRISTTIGDSAPGDPAYQQWDPPGFGFDFENGFKGANISRPVSSFTLDIRPENSKVTRTYQQKVEDYVGAVNLFLFRGRQPGEVRLVAARGESRNNQDWQFSFTFQVKKNRTGVDLGNNVSIGNVEGWDRVDPIPVWRTVDIAGQKVTIQVIRQATVWRDYPRQDLTELII